MGRNFFLFKSFRFKVMCFFIVAMIFVALLSGLLIANYALKAQFAQLRQNLMTIAELAAINVDADILTAIPLNQEGASAPEYALINSQLLKIKESIPTIKYLYILTKTEKPGILQFVVDVDSGDEGPDSSPGTEYDAGRFPEMMNGFTAPSADKKLAEDEWGIFLSGYAPIRDKEGQTVALLGVDMQAQDVYNVQEEMRRRSGYILILGILLSVMFGFIISVRVSGQVRELAKGAERVAKGDFVYKVAVKGADEIAHLAHLFNQMSKELIIYIEELKRTTAEKERLLKELEIAQRIQRSFLPEATPKINGLDIAAVNIPARMVSGDFYDFIPIEEGKWGLVIADVSGKGVPAALFMALSRTLLRASASVTLSPSETLRRANELILRDSRSDLFVTLFYAVLETGSFSFKYANAGHNPPIVSREGTSDSVFLRAQSTPLGISQDIKVLTEELMLKKNDLIVLYTDGVIDAVNQGGEHFEMSRLTQVVRDSRTFSASEIMRRIQDEVTAFVGGIPQYDDITLMIIKAV